MIGSYVFKIPVPTADDALYEMRMDEGHEWYIRKD
jgi:hypothetical protein